MLSRRISADEGATGATGKPFGFSFSRGRNAHFPDTGKRFQQGVKQYLKGGAGAAADVSLTVLPPAEVAFPPHGKIFILGKLSAK